MTLAPAIETTGLTRRFGRLTALEGVTCAVRPGESVALVGPNGAGKSTLIKICLGLLKPSAGEARILGADPQAGGFADAKRRIGFLPEQVQFHGALSGRQTLRFYAALKGGGGPTIDELLDRVQLVDAADRAVSTYSKGMRQRLGLAQALLGEPHLLLLDEPMSGLDPEARANFFKILDGEKARGAAIVLSSHILTELEARTDRVAILARGRLKAIGSVSSLRADLGLGARIRVSAEPVAMRALSEHFAGTVPGDRFVNGVAVLECGGDDKLALLRDLVTSGIEFENIEIVEPSLENIFAAYTSGSGQP